ncbi:hypothetical protein BDI4_210124 [Burkholderia diffusa]|nr:hypothetical protein BDI4_210124 [Burkholderia diffusa]
MRYFIVISPNPMFRYSGLGFLTASVMLDPYYVVTLIRDFSAFLYRAAAKVCSGSLRERE